jgi:hypothetical protein
MENILARRDIACPYHRKEPVILVCTHAYCSQNPLMCKVCLDSSPGHGDHEVSLKPVMEAVKDLSQQLERKRLLMEDIELDCERTKERKDLLKYNRESENHFNQLLGHINSQKYHIERSFSLARDELVSVLHSLKEHFTRQLDDFYLTYLSSH